MTDPLVIGHIHMDTVVGGSGEHAPLLKWSIVDRVETPLKFFTPRFALNGNLIMDVKKDPDTGLPLRLTNYSYKIWLETDAYGRSYYQSKEALLNLLAQYVYVCDSEHCQDGQDHRPFTKRMALVNVDGVPKDHIALQFAYVTIELKDASVLIPT